MPRCPRCGKCLSTRQALEYHLVKKFRCKDNVCYVCNAQFENRNSRDNHLLFCKAKKLYETVKSDECNTTILDSNMIVVYCKDNTQVGTQYACERHSSPFSRNLLRRGALMYYVNFADYEDYIIAREYKLLLNTDPNYAPEDIYY